MELSKKQIDVVEVLTGTHDLDYETAKRIAAETNGDMEKALLEVSYLKFTKKK
jgi:hypothetical protein